MIRAAEAYKAQREIRAQGDAAKFLSVLAEYTKAREVTEQRLYIETLQRVLPQAQKIVISPQLEGQSLALSALTGARPHPAAVLSTRRAARASQELVTWPSAVSTDQEEHTMKRLLRILGGDHCPLGIVLPQFVFIISMSASKRLLRSLGPMSGP